MSAPIRALDANKAGELVFFELKSIATSYCGAQDNKIESFVWKECVEFVRANFAHIGVNELREAFSLAAARKFEGVEMTAYYGRFSVEILGRVLTAYDEHRRSIHAALVNEQHEAQRAAELEAVKDRQRAELEAANARRFELVKKNTSVPTWFSVPTGEYEIMQGLGLLKDFDAKEKGRIWIEAKFEALEEYKRLRASLTIEARAMYSEFDMRAIERNLADAPDVLPEKIKPRAEQIYKKMLVFASLAPYAPPIAERSESNF